MLGLSGDQREELQDQLQALAVDQPTIPWLRNREARWVKPKLRLRVRHLAFGSGLLRHATVRGLSQRLVEPPVVLVRGLGGR